MRQCLYPEAKALLSRHSRPLSQIVLEPTHLLMIAAVEDEEGVQIYLDGMNRTQARRGGGQRAFAANLRKQRMGHCEILVSQANELFNRRFTARIGGALRGGG